MRSFVTGLLAAAGLVAVSPGAAENAKSEAPAPVNGKKICRTEAVIGSIMSRRVCRTREEWAALFGKGEAAVDWARDHRAGGGLGEPQ